MSLKNTNSDDYVISRNDDSSWSNEILNMHDGDMKQSALYFHSFPTAGKINISASKPLVNRTDLSLAYSPGVAEPCIEI
jgi:malic enzyme